MNVLSLFDGIGVGKLALEQLGKDHNYFASEIDKTAIGVCNKQLSDITHLGDIKDISGRDLPPIDLIMGGSPCQGFSCEGRQENFEHKQSRLFWEFIRLLKETSPRYFLLENVVMKKIWEEIITSYMGVEPLKINSSLFTCQNRERLYWTNIPLKEEMDIKEETLEDIVDPDLPMDGEVIQKRDKKINKHKLNKIGETDKEIGRERPRRVYSVKGKCPTLLSGGGKDNTPKISFDGDNWRALSIEECEKAQGLPVGYTQFTEEKELSFYKRKILLGNSWTLPVIKYLLSLI